MVPVGGCPYSLCHQAGSAESHAGAVWCPRTASRGAVPCVTRGPGKSYSVSAAGGVRRRDRKQKRRKLAKHVSACARVAGFFFCAVTLKDARLGRNSIVGTRPFSRCSVPRPALICGPPAPDCCVPLRWCQHRQPERGEPWAEWVDVACGACGVVGGGV